MARYFLPMPIMLMLVYIQQTSVSHFFHWTGANVGHQNSLRPSALDKEEGTVSKLNHISTTFRAEERKWSLDMKT